MTRVITLALLALLATACEFQASTEPVAASGVKKVDAEVTVDAEGLTVEQRNVRDRLTTDNQPGSIKHMYVISAWSGDVILYSTVRGKVTSSGKRLTPTTVGVTDGQYVDGSNRGISVNLDGNKYRTGEVLQDDGTYGSSIDYLFWWDSQGRYHQHYPSGGQIIHVSDQPMEVGRVIINLEASAAPIE